MAGRASEAIIQQIRQANDIVDVLSSYVTLKRAGRRLKALCPFHQEKTPSFTVNPEMQVFHCFGCGVGGDVFKFIQLRENVDFPDALAMLAARAGISLEESPASRRKNDAAPSKVELERLNQWACRWFQQQFRGPAGEAARSYVASRGITAESVDRFGIGYAPPSWDAFVVAAQAAKMPLAQLIASGLAKGRDDGSPYAAFRNRLMFPIKDVMDRVVGFGGRTLGDDPAKYVNSPQSPLFDKSKCLYGVATAKHAFAKRRTAVVVEGYVDCLMAQQHGFDHTVATLGTALTPDHVRLLRRYVDQVILVFDSDEAGQRAADNSLRLFLTEGLDVRLTRVPEAKDPADLLLASGAAAFERVLTSATDALESKWSQIRRRYRDAATGSDRRRAIEDFLGLVASSADLNACDPIQRGLILNQVGKLLGLPGEEVNRQLRIIARRTAAAPSGPSSSRPVAPRLRDAATAAMRHLLEVVLNDPACYGSVADEFDPALLDDEELRQVASAVVELAGNAGGFTLPQLIGRFDSVAISGRILGLHAAGEREGNFAAKVEGALKRLRGLREWREKDQLVTDLRAGDIPDQPQSDQDQNGSTVSVSSQQRSMLRALHQKHGGIGAFAGHRHSVAAASSGAGAGGPPGPAKEL